VANLENLSKNAAASQRLAQQNYYGVVRLTLPIFISIILVKNPCFFEFFGVTRLIINLSHRCMANLFCTGQQIRLKNRPSEPIHIEEIFQQQPTKHHAQLRLRQR
jgi:hypothetical protein